MARKAKIAEAEVAPAGMSLEQAMALAYGHWNAGQADQAERLCQQVLQVWPEYADALHLLGLLAHGHGNPSLALDFVRRACATPRAPALFHSNLAEMCRQSGLLAEGETAARRAVTLDNRLTAAWNNLGIILQEAGKLEESRDSLQRVVDCTPDNPQAHNNLGNTLKRLGRLNEARRHYDQAIGLNPTYSEAHSNLANLLNELGEAEAGLVEARQAIETAVRLAPDAPEVIENYGDYFYYGYRDYARAVEQYQRLAVLRPNDAVVFGSLGLIHRRQGRMRESLTELRRAMELEPRNVRYVRAAQQLSQALNLYPEATALQQQVVSLSPGDVIEQFTLALIPFNAQGSIKEGQAMFENVKADPAHEPLLFFGRKQFALLTGNWAEAIRLDGEHRYYDFAGVPHWSQDLAMAFVLAAQGDKPAARARAAATIP